MKKIKTIKYEDISSLALGAGILGSGGGGDTVFLQKIAETQYKSSQPIKLICVDDLKPDDIVIPIGYIGAPLVQQEKISSGKEFITIFEQMEKQLGKKPTVIMAGEIGGSNGLVPLIVAQKLNLPILDGDGMGRAFPELQMCSFFVNNINPTPACIANNSGTTVTIASKKNMTNIENIARHVTIAFGSDAAIALYPMTGLQAKTTAIAETISQAILLGKTIKSACKAGQDPIKKLCEKTNALLLISGTIIDIEQKIDHGFLKGKVTITSAHNSCIIEYQNEYLLASINKKIIATTPDIIAIIQTETGQPIMSESLRFGISVSIIVLPAPTIWSTAQGLKLVGPQYFGYKTAYKPCKGITS